MWAWQSRHVAACIISYLLVAKSGVGEFPLTHHLPQQNTEGPEEKKERKKERGKKIIMTWTVE